MLYFAVAKLSGQSIGSVIGLLTLLPQLDSDPCNLFWVLGR